ncbi:AMP-binding protein [Vibrio lentus]|uniref:AMP-binding protein n=1 Tax=Vibrio lentus TaxID=136468 RepID=UPI000CB44E27|nr:hypothetical protein BCU36_17070 [Vibrio lentus]
MSWGNNKRSQKFIPFKNIAEIPFYYEKLKPDSIAIKYLRNGNWHNKSWKELCHDIKSLAEKFLSEGILSYDRVIVKGEASYEWILVDMAIFSIGAVSIPVKTNVSQQYIFDLKQISGASRVIDLSTINEDCLDSNVSTFQIFNTELASIMFTSGSTGKPKGVLRSHKSFIWNISYFHDIGEVVEGDSYYLMLSPNQIIARQGLYRALSWGMIITIPDKIDIDFDISTFIDMQPTHTSWVPRCMMKVVKDKGFLSNAGTSKEKLGGNLKHVSYGGARLPDIINSYLDDGSFQMINGYGSTECGVVATQTDELKYDDHCGVPLNGYELKIVDDELYVKSEGIFDGYLTDDGVIKKDLDEHGFFPTGDIAEITEKGLKIHGRKDGSFPGNNGVRVFPAFLESELESQQDIDEAIVVFHEAKIQALIFSKKDTSVEKAISNANKSLNSWEHIESYCLVDSPIPESIRKTVGAGKVRVDRELALEHFKSLTTIKGYIRG